MTVFVWFAGELNADGGYPSGSMTALVKWRREIMHG
jgi:hypothetical protein